MDDKILRVLRAQAWERAKGELRSMLSASYSVTDFERKQFREVYEAVKAFVAQVDDNGWAD